MALTIDQLIASQTKDQIQATLYTNLQTLGFSVTSWRPGGVARTIVAILSTVLAAFTVLMVVVAKSGFLDFASGDWLTLLAKQFFDVDRQQATFASGFLTLTNSGGGVYTYATGTYQVKSAVSGKLYVNTAPFTLNASTSITVPIQALEVGSASTANPGDISIQVVTLVGVTIGNAAAVVGLDVETDDSLRQRCRDKFGALSPNGPLAVYDYVARTSSLNGGVNVTRTKVYGDNPSGHVTQYIADASGAVDGGVVTSVQNAINNLCVPQCVTATISSATNVPVSITCDVWVYAAANVPTATIQANVQAALTAFFPTTPISGDMLPGPSGWLYLKSLERVILDAANSEQMTFTAPLADTAIPVGGVAVLSGTPTINVHQV